MRLSLRLLLGYFLIVGIAGYFVLNIFVQEVKPGVRRSMEGTLIDTSNVLARIAAQDIATNNIRNGHLAQAFNALDAQPIGAVIDGIKKNYVEYRIYVTDINGIVIFDSSRRDLGKDYSLWNDVYLTLRGKYGARSTQDNPNDPDSSVMYVAAPVKINGQLVGVLTVAKANKAMTPVIRRSERRILLAGGILLGLSLLIGGAFVWWINRDIRRLVNYSERVADGQQVRLPEMKAPELATLAKSMEEMRLKLEGKAYIERYVHTLTHELKSPLAAIRGAAEILQESPPPETAKRFVSNIQQQSQRIQRLVDRMLLQAKVENRAGIEHVPVDLAPLLLKTFSGKEAQASTHNISIRIDEIAPCQIKGDALLLSQAVANLLDNALDFTPSGGEVVILGIVVGDYYQLTVRDSGVGIPDYALEKVFERFYSLPRPDKGKSSGLGLSFVKEVAMLHRGDITLENSPEGGAIATLTLALRH